MYCLELVLFVLVQQVGDVGVFFFQFGQGFVDVFLVEVVDWQIFDQGVFVVFGGYCEIEDYVFWNVVGIVGWYVYCDLFVVVVQYLVMYVVDGGIGG